MKSTSEDTLEQVWTEGFNFAARSALGSVPPLSREPRMASLYRWSASDTPGRLFSVVAPRCSFQSFCVALTAYNGDRPSLGQLVYIPDESDIERTLASGRASWAPMPGVDPDFVAARRAWTEVAQILCWHERADSALLMRMLDYLGRPPKPTAML